MRKYQCRSDKRLSRIRTVSTAFVRLVKIQKVCLVITRGQSRRKIRKFLTIVVKSDCPLELFFSLVPYFNRFSIPFRPRLVQNSTKSFDGNRFVKSSQGGFQKQLRKTRFYQKWDEKLGLPRNDAEKYVFACVDCEIRAVHFLRHEISKMYNDL